MQRLADQKQGDPMTDVREIYIQSCFEFSLWLFTEDDHLQDDPDPLVRAGAKSNPPRAQLKL
jgi:hypothetical protein